MMVGKEKVSGDCPFTLGYTRSRPGGRAPGRARGLLSGGAVVRQHFVVVRIVLVVAPALAANACAPRLGISILVLIVLVNVHGQAAGFGRAGSLRILNDPSPVGRQLKRHLRLHPASSPPRHLRSFS